MTNILNGTETVLVTGSTTSPGVFSGQSIRVPISSIGYSGQNNKVNIKNSRFAPIMRSSIRQIIPSAQAPTTTWQSPNVNPFNSSFNATISGTVMTVTTTPTAPVTVGSLVAGSGVTGNSIITSNGTGTGGTGTYNLSQSSSVGTATAMTAKGLQWTTSNYPGIVGASYFTFTRCSNIVTGTTYPAYTNVAPSCVNFGTPASPNFGYDAYSASFIFNGQNLVLMFTSLAANVLIKVDDQYISLTPQTTDSSGNLAFALLAFQSVGRRRIEIIMASGNAVYFGGVWTGVNDTIQQANVRGPRCIFVTDSFGQNPLGVGSSGSYPIVFGELMGWDDVWPSSCGGTGFLANNSGVGSTYRQRLATDVIPFAPDMVVFQGSVNDAGYTAAQIQAEATLCAQQLQAALPNCLMVFAGPMISKAPSYAAQYLLLHRAALKAVAAQFGGVFLDFQQPPISGGVAPQVTTLSAAISANAGSITTQASLSPGSYYTFPDGTEFYCRSTSGGSAPYGAVIDISSNAQAAGTVITQVGNCPYIGNGHVNAITGFGNCDVLIGSDGVHPTQRGTEVIAETLVYLFMSALYSN